MSKPLIFITNDDGVTANGIAALIEMVQPYGRLVVVAPDKPNSGMSHALTVEQPIRIRTIQKSDELSIYACTGTPADCVKLGMSHVLNDKPDLIVSGINHGSNASVSVLYSGTLAAAAEGCLYDIPAIGFSLCDHSRNADFSASIFFGRQIVEKVLADALHARVYLNVNVPNIPQNEIKGIRLCRQTKGNYREEYEKRVDPRGHDYYWLTGSYINEEPMATDTDEYMLAKGYVSVVPIQPDMTAYTALADMQRSWGL